MNAVNFRSMRMPPARMTRIVWPPESINADLNVDDFVLRPQGLDKSSIGAGLVLPFLAALCFSVLIAYLMYEFRHVFMDLGRWGYLGVFFFELANSATIMFPTPGQTYRPYQQRHSPVAVRTLRRRRGLF